MSEKLFKDPNGTAGDLFQRHQDEINKPSNFIRRTVFSALVIWVMWVLFCLIAIAGLIYTAIHFISKAW